MLQEKFDLFTRLNARIVELEKTESANAAALPLMFQLSQVNAERYSDNKLYAAEKHQAGVNCALQTEIMMRPVGKVALPFSDLITSCPSLPKVVYNVTDCGCGCGSSKA